MLRLECPPDSLVHFQSWISEIGNHATEILYVRSDVAFGIPLPLSELFLLSPDSLGNYTESTYLVTRSRMETRHIRYVGFL
jgi:hypothetical protein